MTRPVDLPEFTHPPLNEMVLGVQFDVPPGYRSIDAGAVWALFAGDFPEVQEQPFLPPTFETFGPNMASPFGFGFASSFPSRYWFLGPKGDELLQFQRDRLLHNWRKVGDQSNSYPRFDTLIAKFKTELHKLQDHFAHDLVIRQCEVSYINHLRAKAGAELDVRSWLKFACFAEPQPEDLSMSFRRALRGQDGHPRSRLICDVSLVDADPGDRMILFSLTVRGLPEQATIDSSIEFLGQGRNIIVSAFTDSTTNAAHQVWGRTK